MAGGEPRGRGVRLASCWKYGQALAAQFDTYKPFADLNLNGEMELSENVADLSCLSVAFDAF